VGGGRFTLTAAISGILRGSNPSWKVPDGTTVLEPCGVGEGFARAGKEVGAGRGVEFWKMVVGLGEGLVLAEVFPTEGDQDQRDRKLEEERNQEGDQMTQKGKNQLLLLNVTLTRTMMEVLLLDMLELTVPSGRKPVELTVSPAASMDTLTLMVLRENTHTHPVSHVKLVMML
jgi:hypothetical protein